MRESEERKHIVSLSHSRMKTPKPITNFPRRRHLPPDSGQDARGKLPSSSSSSGIWGLHTLQPLAIVYVNPPCRVPSSLPLLFFHVLLIPLENVELCGNEIPFVDRGFEGGREDDDDPPRHASRRARRGSGTDRYACATPDILHLFPGHIEKGA